jgi:DNA adenine methylase
MKMKTPVSYYGGKQSLLRYILPLIPKNNITLYCEPFFGGGAVFFAKEPHEVEVINDLNSEVINFYRVLQCNFVELQKEIKQTLHSRELHTDAYVIYTNPHLFDEVKRAWAFYVLCSQGFASGIGKGWGYARLDDACEKKVRNAKERFTDIYQKRIEKVQIECTDALKVIKSRDFEKAFFYCDPPYYNSYCGHYKGYSIDDFEELLIVLSNIKGQFLLSSYPSDVLNKYVKQMKWHQTSIEKTIAVTSATKKKKTEVLTSNYKI